MVDELIDLGAFRKARDKGKDTAQALKVCRISNRALRAKVHADALRQTALPDHIPKDAVLIRTSDCPPRFKPMAKRKKICQAENQDPSTTQEIETVQAIGEDKEYKLRYKKVASENPQVWEFLNFVAHQLTTSEVGILYDSVAPYFRNIRVSEASIKKLYSILESESKTKQLLQQEMEFWTSLIPAQERPWRAVYERYWNSKSIERRQSKTIYDPLYTPAYKFSNQLVRVVLLLRFLFRQHFPPKRKFRKIRKK